MGKVKKGKKHSHQPKALGKLLLSSDRLQQELEEQQNEEHQRKISEKYNLSELQTNLNSLLSEKRLNACRILSDIYEFNQNAQDTLDVLTNQSILTSLLSRIADTSSLGIQVHASNAIKTLSESKSSTIIEKLISGGIYRTMINLAVSRIDASHFILPSSNTSNSNQSKPTLPREIEFEITFFQNLLYSIANIVARYPIAIQEITTSTSPTNTLEGGVASNSFLTFLFTLLQTPNLHTRVINTVLNVFITFSKVTPKSSSSSSSNTATSPVALIFLQPLVNNNSITGIQLFHQYLTFLIQVGLFHQPAITTPTDDLALIQAFTTSYTIYKEEEYDTLILLLQTIEILLNVLLRCPLNSEGGVIGVSYYIKIAFHLMQLLSQSQDNEYHMTIEEIKKDVEEEEAAKLDYSEVKGIKDTTSQPQTMNVEMNMDETDHSTNPEVSQESTKKENQKNSGKSYLSSIIHHKIDLIEIVSELFVSLIQQVQRQHRGSSLFPSEEEDNDESNDINITPLSSNSSSVALLQCLEECDVFSFLLRHTLPYGKQLFSYCVIPTKSDDNNNQCHIILGEGVRILNVLEKVTIALDLAYTLKSSLFSFVASDVMIQSVNLAQHFSLYLEHLQFLYECLNRVTATQDATQSVVELWKAKEEEHLLSLKTVILQQSITFIHILYSFLLYANSSSNPTQKQLAQYFRTNIFRQEGAMKALLTPILFNWMNLPQFELLLSLYHLLFLIINTYTQLLETTPLNAAADSNDFPIPKSIYIFIMNSLMNRVNESACYLYDISKTASSEEEKRKKKNGKKGNEKAGNTSSSKKSSKGGSVKNPSKSVHEMWKDSKQYNLYKSSLLWKDLLVNCLIDLNCSDHKQLHSWYTAYQTNEKLMVVGKKMQEEYEQLVQFHQRNYSFIPLQGENDDEDDVEDEDEEAKEEKERILPIAVRLTINDRDKIEETLMNVENFIIYKRSNNF